MGWQGGNLTTISEGETYTHHSGRLYSDKYKMSFVIPSKCTGRMTLDHIFVINSDDNLIDCTIYLHDPTVYLMSDWINEAFDINGHGLQPGEIVQPSKNILVKRYFGDQYVGYKITLDSSGYGLGAIVEGFLNNEGATIDFVNELIKSIQLSIPCVHENEGEIKPELEPDVQNYAKKYNFHELLNRLLSMTNDNWEKFIIENPIVRSEPFAKFLRNRIPKIEDELKKIEMENSDIIPRMINRIDSLENYILSTAKAKKSKETLSSNSRNLKEMTQCIVCAGTGYLTCSSCGGLGYHTSSYTNTTWDGNIEYIDENIPCSSCVGGKETCWKCGGSGMVLD